VSQFVVYLGPNIVDVSTEDDARMRIVKAIFSGEIALDVLAIDGTLAPRKYVNVASAVAFDLRLTAEATPVPVPVTPAEPPA